MVKPTPAEQMDMVNAFLKEKDMSYPTTLEKKLCLLTRHGQGWMVEVDLKVLVNIDKKELTKMREDFEAGLE